MNLRLCRWGGLTLLICALTACRTAPKSSKASAPLEGTLWKLAELEGAAVPDPANSAKPATLKLDAATQRATGFAGVNQFRGTYTLDGASLKFSPFISTRMAGAPAAMTLEKTYLAALAEVTAWSFVDGQLELSAGNRRVARFNSQTPAAPPP